MEEIKEVPKAIDWPRVRIGSQIFVLRYSYATSYQLAKWKKTVQTATNVELAAAMCGTFDADGKWHSTGFGNPVELADLIADVEPDRQMATETAVVQAITDALKKAFPALEIVQKPAQNGEVTTSTDSSTSGPSQLREAV